eukprot:7252087-Prymnesium_polylepis.1
MYPGSPGFPLPRYPGSPGVISRGAKSWLDPWPAPSSICVSLAIGISVLFSIIFDTPEGEDSPADLVSAVSVTSGELSTS